MAITLNATTSSGLVITPDNSGNVLLQYNGQAAPAFSVYCSSTQTISTGTYTKIQFNTKVFDTATAFDTATNYRFTPLVAGYYQISLYGRDASGISSALQISLFKNGASVAENIGAVSGNGLSSGVNFLVYMNGSTDYLEGYVKQTSGGNMTLTNASNLTFFTGILVRAA